MRGLLPCPFCGWAAIMREWTSGMHYYRAECSNTEGCDCHGLQHLTLGEAIAAWNRRANLGSCENELIVRCENCKHYNRIGCLEGFGWCESMDRGVSDDFYCANGTKMESEGGT